MFSIDDRIHTTCFILGNWSLSNVYLKNDQSFPWFLLVPRREGVQELHHLNKEDRSLLMEEMNRLSLIINDFFKPTKLNTGALGNIVPQLHVHIVARTVGDPLWPQGIWQDAHRATPYSEEQLNKLLPALTDRIHAGAKDLIIP